MLEKDDFSPTKIKHKYQWDQHMQVVELGVELKQAWSCTSNSTMKQEKKKKEAVTNKDEGINTASPLLV